MSTRVFKQSGKKRPGSDRKNNNAISILPNICITATIQDDEDSVANSIPRENLVNERAKSPITTGNANYDQSGFITYVPKNHIIPLKQKLVDPNVLLRKKIVFAKSNENFNENNDFATVEVDIENESIEKETRPPNEKEHSQINIKKAPWKQCKKEFYEQKSLYDQNELLLFVNLNNDLSDDFFSDEGNWTYEFTLNLVNEVGHHYKSRRNFPMKPYDKNSISIFSEPADVAMLSIEKINKLKIEIQNCINHNKPLKLSSMLQKNLSNINESPKENALTFPLLQRQKSSLGASFGGRNFELK